MYPGTFDPLTLGHEEIIDRAANLFDHLLISVAKDSSKATMFEIDERLKLVEIISSRYSNVTASSYDGLTVDFAKSNNINVILRGVRNSSDFIYESQISQTNNTMDKSLESIFFIASDSYKSITSSLVREVINLNGDYSKFVSQEVANFLNKIKAKSL
jgi:pantetheine-phosphate adenylyltransferase|tara:strand:+ start:592 stop:1065 length:474 start_codon:yes stop_codon:yes gene_type:complete